jgi:integrase/recombinase XerD
MCRVLTLERLQGLRCRTWQQHPKHRLIAPFSVGELERLLALAEPRERALTLLLLDTGLPLAEVAALRVGDLRPDGTIRVMGKGAKERIVPLGATARRALLRYVAGRDPVGPADALFVGRYGAPLSRRGMQYAIARLGRRAGVGTRSSPHTFRHTFARDYLVRTLLVLGNWLAAEVAGSIRASS